MKKGGGGGGGGSSRANFEKYLGTFFLISFAEGMGGKIGISEKSPYVPSKKYLHGLKFFGSVTERKMDKIIPIKHYLVLILKMYSLLSTILDFIFEWFKVIKERSTKIDLGRSISESF